MPVKGEKMHFKASDNLLVQKMGQELTEIPSDILIIAAEVVGRTQLLLSLTIKALSKQHIALKLSVENEILTKQDLITHKMGNFRAYKHLKEQMNWSQETKEQGR